MRSAFHLSTLHAALLAMSLVGGCMSAPDKWAAKVYEGPDRLREETAVITTRIQETVFFKGDARTKILTVDGFNRPNGPIGVHGVEVLPGEHKIELVRNTMGAIGRREQYSWVTLTVKPGHTYLAQSDRIEDTTYFWVEDKDSGEIVSDEKPPLATMGAQEQPWDEINDWMKSEPRTVAIRIEADLPQHRMEVHESRTWQGAGAGAGKGAVEWTNMSIQEGARTGPLSFIVGMALLPVGVLTGAIAGAAGAEPEISYQSIDQIAGAEPMFEVVARDADLRELIGERVSLALYHQKRSGVSFSPSSEARTAQSLMNADLIVAIDVRRYDLLGEKDDDPSVRLLIEGDAVVGSYELGLGYTCPWSHESEQRRISEWAENGAEAFQSAIHTAASAIAREVALALLRGGGRCRDAAPYAQYQASWEACHLPLRDAENLETTAQRRRGDLCSGYGQPVAWRWLCLSAHQGDREARFRIGESYRLGRKPVERDSVTAYSWYILASTQGHEAASEALANLSTQMTARQIAQAGSLAAEWMPDIGQCDRYLTGSAASVAEGVSSALTIPEYEEPFNPQWIVLARAERQAGVSSQVGGVPTVHDGTYRGKAVFMSQFCDVRVGRYELKLTVDNGRLGGGDTAGTFAASGTVGSDGRLIGARLNNRLLLEGSLSDGTINLANRDCGARYELSRM